MPGECVRFAYYDGPSGRCLSVLKGKVGKRADGAAHLGDSGDENIKNKRQAATRAEEFGKNRRRKPLSQFRFMNASTFSPSP